MTRQAIETCRGCGAEWTGNLERDEDDRVYVHFEISPFGECARCQAAGCDDCLADCCECNEALCEKCAQSTDEGKMCAACATEYRALVAAEETA